MLPDRVSNPGLFVCINCSLQCVYIDCYTWSFVVYDAHDELLYPLHVHPSVICLSSTFSSFYTYSEL